MSFKLQKAFGEILREERLKKELSQEALAFRSNLDRTFVSLMERGKRQPSIESLFRIAQALSMKPSEIIRTLESRFSNN